jgi:small GTP-binding protein
MKCTNSETELLSNIKELNSLAAKLNDHKILKKLDELKKTIISQTPKVAFIGSYNSGKSSLINFILGKDILPIGIIPVTAVEINIKYGLEEHCSVEKEDNSIELIDTCNLCDYVSESNNPDNIKKVSKITVFCDSAILKYGIELIDTPGISSVHSHNTKLAYEILERVDSVVFVYSSLIPISENELDYLKKSEKYINKIIFVRNKIDLISAKDFRQMESYARDIIINNTNIRTYKEFPITSISTDNLNNFLSILLDELKNSIIQNKDEIFTHSHRRKLRKICSLFIANCKLKEHILLSSSNDIQNNLESYKNILNDLEHNKSENIVIINHKLHDILDDMNKWGKNYIDKNKMFCARVIDTYISNSSNIKFSERLKTLDSLIESNVSDVINNWNENAHTKFNKDYKNILNGTILSINETIDTINKATIVYFKTSLIDKIDDLDFGNLQPTRLSFKTPSYSLQLVTANDFMRIAPEKVKREWLKNTYSNNLEDSFQKNLNNGMWPYKSLVKDIGRKFENIYNKTLTDAKEVVTDVILEASVKLRNEINDTVTDKTYLEKIISESTSIYDKLG